jgi:hypothetical protein
MSDSFFPFDPNNLSAGPGRFLYAPGTTTLTSSPKTKEIFSQVAVSGAYPPATGWTDGGGTIDAPSLARNLTVSGFGYQQSSGNVVERPTDTERTVTVPFGELTPAVLEIIEQNTQATLAAGANQGSAKAVDMEAITDLGFYRVALAWKFQKSQGVVTEPGGGTRGRFAVWLGYRASISGDNVTMAIDESAAWQSPVTFKLLPDSGFANKYGRWIIEDAPQTISAT